MVKQILNIEVYPLKTSDYVTYTGSMVHWSPAPAFSIVPFTSGSGSYENQTQINNGISFHNITVSANLPTTEKNSLSLERLTHRSLIVKITFNDKTFLIFGSKALPARLTYTEKVDKSGYYQVKISCKTPLTPASIIG